MRIILLSALLLTACTEHSIDEYKHAEKQCAEIKMVVTESLSGKLCCSHPMIYTCNAYPSKE